MLLPSPGNNYRINTKNAEHLDDKSVQRLLISRFTKIYAPNDSINITGGVSMVDCGRRMQKMHSVFIFACLLPIPRQDSTDTVCAYRQTTYAVLEATRISSFQEVRISEQDALYRLNLIQTASPAASTSKDAPTNKNVLTPPPPESGSIKSLML